jgi:hypothetical protein
MADIKAKDISVAQSVGANDLILGSSIAGTTANVRVDTLGNYLINTLTYSSLSNDTISNSINNINSKLPYSYSMAVLDPNYVTSGRIEVIRNRLISCISLYDIKFTSDANRKTIATLPEDIIVNIPSPFTNFPIIDNNGAFCGSISLLKYDRSIILRAPSTSSFFDKYLYGCLIVPQ